MKLNKIKFAEVFHELARCGYDGSAERLDELIDVEVPISEPVRINVGELHMLMELMCDGTKKIDAIKLHRQMTGYGLKDSKDAVEKYWPNQNWPEYFKKVQDALGTAETGNGLVEVARNAHRAEFELASQHNKEGATLGDILGKAAGKTT